MNPERRREREPRIEIEESEISQRPENPEPPGAAENLKLGIEVLLIGAVVIGALILIDSLVH